MKKIFLSLKKTTLLILLAVFGCFFGVSLALAGAPSGSNWFQLLASPYTGTDNTGDGGTGNTADYNYYYVGQVFNTQIEISSLNTNSANIWIDFDTAIVSSTNPTSGSYFLTYSGHKIEAGRLKLTGLQMTGNVSGTGNFGGAQFKLLRPTASAYGIGAPSVIEVNVGTLGNTTESNISFSSGDILDSYENFYIHVWADTKKPYATNFSPANGSSGVTVESAYTFDLYDSKNGEGDNSGVGTGVNTATPPGAITIDDGSGPADITAYDSYSCSGIWGSNLCSVSFPTLPSLTGITGDTRKWDYGKTYTVVVSNFADYASASQNQLGDANGPNTMDTKTVTFSTESDTGRPTVDAVSPSIGSTNISVATNLTIDIVDKKSANVSGTGIDPATCRINVSSPSRPLTTYQQGLGTVTVTAIDYGYRYTINPASDFAQNEMVSVSIYNCRDLAAVANTMTTVNYTFNTADTSSVYVGSKNPANDAVIALNGTVGFNLRDDGIGIDLSNTIIFVNGVYYTNTGGPGTITLNGVTVSFNALNFNGGNYAGDTTGRTGTAGNYNFIIDPQANFIAAEAVPVIIYSRDTSGNVMSPDIYSLVAQYSNAICDGSTYCGANTTWDLALSKCVGTGGGSIIGSGGGNGGPVNIIQSANASAIQIDETTVLITWYSSLPGSSRVIYGNNSPVNYGSAPNYNYQNSTIEENVNSTYHSVVVSGLQPGQVYYFKPVTESNGNELLGPQLVMATKYGTIQACPAAPVCEEEKVCPVEKVCPTEKTCPVIPVCPVCADGETCPVCPVYEPGTGTAVKPGTTTGTLPAGETAGTNLGETTTGEGGLTDRIRNNLLKILSIRVVQNEQEKDKQRILIIGTATPLTNIKLIIY